MVVYKNSLFLFGGRNPNDSTNHYNDVWKANFVNVCDFKSNGKVHLTADCTLHNEILVTDKLEIYGTEISPQGLLESNPKLAILWFNIPCYV